jgi:tRNA pseudouridine38-40 synthase
VQDELRFFKLILEYDGTDFHGWQVQPDQRTVQGTLIEALKTITRSEVTVRGASRTDRGVHAFGQVARAAIQTRIPETKIRPALNGILPDDVSVRLASEVTEDFYPRYHARGKHYRYLVTNHDWRSPLHRRSSWHRRPKLNVSWMAEAAKVLVGRHDFASFTRAKQERTTTRTVTDLMVTAVDSEIRPNIISVDVAGDGFLWNMVRTIVGTLVEVGQGRIAVAEMAGILAARNRCCAGQTAPPQGLSLMQVFYDEDPTAVPPLWQESVIVA